MSKHGRTVDVGKAHVVVGKGGYVEDGDGSQDLFLELFVDGTVESVLGQVGSVLAVGLGDLHGSGVGSMVGCIAGMHGCVERNTGEKKVFVGWHDDGEMAVSTAAMSRIDSAGIGV